MKEIGGYLEFEHFKSFPFHKKSKKLNMIKLNSGRCSLAYLIKSKNIKKILLPYFNCDCVEKICKKYDVKIRFYNIDKNFFPLDIKLQEDEYFYLVNFYGQLNLSDIEVLIKKYKNKVIVDNVQAFFNMPLKNSDTIYSCRKFFGVADGAILYTDSILYENIQIEKSYDKMNFLLGRFENSSTEFYEDFVKNNERFEKEKIKYMSKLTENILYSLNLKNIKNIRSNNFKYMHDKLSCINELNINVVEGAFSYPFMIDDSKYVLSCEELKKELIKRKIFIPTLWPNVLKECKEDTLEFKFARDILPIPIDQRYDFKDMEYIYNNIKNLLNF